LRPFRPPSHAHAAVRGQLACHSAWGPNADWRGSSLNCLRKEGSNSEADSQATLEQLFDAHQLAHAHPPLRQLGRHHSGPDPAVCTRAVASIDFSNRSESSDSNFALDGFRSPAEDSAWQDTEIPTLRNCRSFLSASIPQRRSLATMCYRSRRPLFARNTLVRRWGRMGSTVRQRREFFDSRDSAGLALEAWLARRRKRGYILR
jgi:hypothetical protein